MKRKTIFIKTLTGKRKVAARTDGPFLAVHPSLGTGGYSVTHIPTGLRLGPSLPSEFAAEECIARIVACGVDLNFKSEAELNKRGKDKVKLRAAIYRTQKKKK